MLLWHTANLLPVLRNGGHRVSLTVPDSPAENKQQKGSMRSVGVPEYLRHRKGCGGQGNVKAHVGQWLHQDTHVQMRL